jgi:hypothetical protein
MKIGDVKEYFERIKEDVIDEVIERYVTLGIDNEVLANVKNILVSNLELFFRGKIQG